MGEKHGRTPSLEEASFTTIIAQCKIVTASFTLWKIIDTLCLENECIIERRRLPKPFVDHVMLAH
jgi:hypothetical protein